MHGAVYLCSGGAWSRCWRRLGLSQSQTVCAPLRLEFHRIWLVAGRANYRWVLHKHSNAYKLYTEMPASLPCPLQPCGFIINAVALARVSVPLSRLSTAHGFFSLDASRLASPLSRVTIKPKCAAGELLVRSRLTISLVVTMCCSFE